MSKRQERRRKGERKGGGASVPQRPGPGIYCDGATIGRNPSRAGGAWAWLEVDEDYRCINEVCEIVRPADMGLDFISCNVAELLAALHGLGSCHDGWSGTIYTDSKITYHRIKRGSRCTTDGGMVGVPIKLIQRRDALHKRLGKYKTVLVAGHPTKEDLERGYKLSGTPCSIHNVRCDEMCTRLMNSVGGQHSSHIPWYNDPSLGSEQHPVVSVETTMTLTFGKYKGVDIASVPIDYLRWAYTSCTRVESDPLLKHAIAKRLGILEVDERGKEITPTSALLFKARISGLERQLRELRDERDTLNRELLTLQSRRDDDRGTRQIREELSLGVDRAYHTLAMKFHPDRGGNDDDMQVINGVIEDLRKVLNNGHTNTVR